MRKYIEKVMGIIEMGMTMRKSIIVLLAGLALALILVACSDETSGKKENDDKQTEEPKDNNENNEKSDNDDGDSEAPGKNNDVNADNEDNNADEEESKKTGKYTFERPDTVRGIYLTGHSAG